MGGRGHEVYRLDFYQLYCIVQESQISTLDIKDIILLSVYNPKKDLMNLYRRSIQIHTNFSLG